MKLHHCLTTHPQLIQNGSKMECKPQNNKIHKSTHRHYASGRQFQRCFCEFDLRGKQKQKYPHQRICLLILEREEIGRRERERERHQNINRLPPICAPTGDRTSNLGMCPNQESNLHCCGIQENTPTSLFSFLFHSFLCVFHSAFVLFVLPVW